MESILVERVQEALDSFACQDLFLHLEITNGVYTVQNPDNGLVAGAYIRNGQIRYQRGTITGKGPYRVGLKMEHGWVYAEGLTHWEIDEEGRLLLAGHDQEGRIAVALQLSKTPFR